MQNVRYAVLSLFIFTLPLMGGDIVDTAQKSGKFKILLTAANEAGLVDALKSKGPLTILAPTDEAFGKLPKGTLEDFLKPENKDKLSAVLKYHVIAGKLSARNLAGTESVESLSGEELFISIKDGRLILNESKVIGSDIEASNGIIHVVDSVLLPPKPESPEQKMMSLIEETIEIGAPLYNKGQREACAAIYKLTAKALLSLAGDNLNDKIINDIKNTLKKVNDNSSHSSNAWSLRGVLDRTFKHLQHEEVHIETGSKEPVMPAGMKVNDFKVRLEAELPAGFPQPGPLNQVVIKEYPEYRAAKVGGTSMQNVAFMRLFAHIKQNGISMTAPVEMALDGDSAKRQSMSFLYGNQNIGKTGTQSAGVEVLDLPAQKYVSIGFNGTETKAAIKKAISKLESWLEEKKRHYSGRRASFARLQQSHGSSR